MEEQQDELLAIQSIYEDDDRLLIASNKDDPGGVFLAPQTLPSPLAVCMGSAGGSNAASNGEKRPAALTVKHLPPIALNFVFPWDYPSEQAPHFTLTCSWLSRQQLTKLCQHLDEIWQENEGFPILFTWFQFLQNQAMEFLDITSPLKLSSLVPHSKPHCPKTGGSSNQDICSIKAENTSITTDCSDCTDSDSSTQSRGQKGSDNPSKVSAPTDCADPSHVRSIADANSSQSQSCCETQTFEDVENGDVDDSELNLDCRAIQEVSTATQLLKILKEFDQQQEQEEFNKSYVSCGVCFTDSIGRQCMRFVECRHAYCRKCLGSYFSVLIKEGSVKALNCPHPDCEFQAYPYQVKELVTAEEYERYDKLLLQTTLDTMADVVYCPRKLCQQPVIKEVTSNMGRCGNCNLTFCTLCKLTYHGLSPCKIKSNDMRKLRDKYMRGNAETKKFLEKRYGKAAIERAIAESFSEEWLEKNAKCCPYCSTHIQKTSGCNKMTCSKCRSYFCWLCDALLSRSNPYSHYGNKQSGCYERLFEGAEWESDEEEWWDEEDFYYEDEEVYE